MAKKAKRTKTRASSVTSAASNVASNLWKFVEENPQIALTIAFEIGALISEATRRRGNVKALLAKQIGKGADLLPQLLAGQENKIPPALKILAGPALQAALMASGSSTAKVGAVAPVKKTKRRKKSKAKR